MKKNQFDQAFMKGLDPELRALIDLELIRQQNHVELIASENYASKAVMQLSGSVLTNKYAEGYPGNRYYNGCENVDVVENLAIKRLKQLFDCGHERGEKFIDEDGNEWICKKANSHANVQPHSGSQANTAAYAAVLKPKATILGMKLDAGGHLTHGYKINFSGRNYHGIGYGVNKSDEKLDYEEIARMARMHKPDIIVAGASAYSRTINWSFFRKIANEVNAYLMVDMAHIAGLIAAKKHPTPVCHADIITTTTHKTLRGPRGGAILCTEALKTKIDSAVFPGNQGGPLQHIIVAKAQAFYEALSPAFTTYQTQVISNAKAFAQVFIAAGYHVIAGGTDNHLFTVKVCNSDKEIINGFRAVQLLEQINIIANKNAVPFDNLPPVVTSGVRFGTPAMTTRGFKEPQFEKLAHIIIAAWKLPFKIINSPHQNAPKKNKELIIITDENQKEQLQRKVAELLKDFPIYEN